MICMSMRLYLYKDLHLCVAVNLSQGKAYKQQLSNMYIQIVYSSSQLSFVVYISTLIVHIKRPLLLAPPVEQELLTFPEHMRSSLVFSGVRVTRSLVLCVMLRRSLFVLFLLTIVLSVLLRFKDSDNPIGIFKPFLVFNDYNLQTYPLPAIVLNAVH